MAVPHSLCCLPCPTASAFLPKAVGDAELRARHPGSGLMAQLR